jgi:hypothetical protein
VSKALSPAQQAEFDRLRSFLGAAFDALMPAGTFPAEVHPIRVLDRTAQQYPSRALRGLRAAVDDMVEATQNTGIGDLAILEARLAEAGAPSLESMRRRRSQTIFAILDRGTIKDDDEWRIIEGAIANQEERVLTGAAREIANELLGRYEGQG